MTLEQKVDYVHERVLKLETSPKVLLHSFANLEKAYQVFKDNPNITREQYLEIMNLEEE